MISLEEQRKIDIQKVSEIYEKPNIFLTGTYFDEYSRFYDFTNEKLFELYQKLDFNTKNSALCVLSSGDHVFNLILQGIYNITTFDCNRVTEYFSLGFKKTAVEVLDYEKFIELFCPYGYSTVTKQLEDIEKEVINCMPKVYQHFWLSFLDMRKEFEPNPSVFDLTYSTSNFAKAISNNKYLLSPKEYNELKKALPKAKIDFTSANITQVPEIFGEFDFIDFSNVLYFYNGIFPNPCLENATEFVKKVYDNNLNDQGIFKYYYDFDGLTKKPMPSQAQDYYLGRECASILRKVKKENVN